ncbi:MAG: hypothetical protein ABWY64_11540 [Tardiphaga sp.]
MQAAIEQSVAQVKRSVTRDDPTYFRVRYSEIDGQRVVFNAHYLTYFDTTIEYFRARTGGLRLRLIRPTPFGIRLRPHRRAR